MRNFRIVHSDLEPGDRGSILGVSRVVPPPLKPGLVERIRMWDARRHDPKPRRPKDHKPTSRG